MSPTPRPRRVRTLFVSDVHLGTKGARAELLMDFLKHHEAETIYLVGDIVDGWRLTKEWYWPEAHDEVIQEFLRRAQRGVKTIYIPGNHDEFLRDYVGASFGGIAFKENDVHTLADGKRMLVMHGDEFDVVVTRAPWLAHVGDALYTFALKLNSLFNRSRRRMGVQYWSLSAWAKRKVKNAVNIIGRYEKTLADEARRNAVDGIVCGHIHTAVIHDKFGTRYVNTGDWVESCTAVVELLDGTLELVQWRRFAVPTVIEGGKGDEADRAVA